MTKRSGLFAITSAHGKIGELLSVAVTQAFQDLLTNKHLYQSVEVSVAAIDEYIKERADAEYKAAEYAGSDRQKESRLREVTEQVKQKKNALEAIWAVTPAMGAFGVPQTTVEANIVYFELPTIYTLCPTCDGRWPFNPFPLHLEDRTSSGEAVVHHMDDAVEVFVCAYQCQACKTEPLVFLIRRRGVKLTLAGRSRIESVPAPAVLPKHVHGFYSDALIAHNAGKTLPGLFMLRVLIEQFWADLERRHVLIVRDERGRLHADQLADAYNDILPREFKDRFPSLGKIYEDISDCLHDARADIKLFEKSQQEIIEHFDARRVMKLDAEDDQRAAAKAPKAKAR